MTKEKRRRWGIKKLKRAGATYQNIGKHIQRMKEKEANDKP